MPPMAWDDGHFHYRRRRFRTAGGMLAEQYSGKLEGWVNSFLLANIVNKITISQHNDRQVKGRPGRLITAAHERWWKWTVVVRHGSGSLRMTIEYVYNDWKWSRSLTRCGRQRPGNFASYGGGGTDVSVYFTSLVALVAGFVILIPTYFPSFHSEREDILSTRVGINGGGGGLSWRRGWRGWYIRSQCCSKSSRQCRHPSGLTLDSIDGTISVASKSRDDISPSLDSTDMLLVTKIMDIQRI